MLYSYDWLKQFVPAIPAPQKLGELLTLHSVEVEEVIDSAAAFEGFIVGAVQSVEAHPNADKLRVCTVQTGANASAKVVCGGTNLEVNHLYAFAPLGTTVQWHGEKEMVLEAVEIRGVESQGMICASDEIGLASLFPKKEEKEVLDITNVVPTGTAPGTPLAEALGLDAVLIDIDNKSMTHRPDLFSHRGMAREIAAVCGVEFKDEAIPVANISQSTLKVDIKNNELCSSYVAIECEVEVGDTPKEIARRLHECGIKSINNVVDITNYVMIEQGQPLHAFDALRVEGETIFVRTAKKGETLVTLDNEEKKLTGQVLVIADSKKPLAIAGVIGGKESGITEATKRIIVEVANFDAVNVRKTTQQLGVRTDSALRFEKGLPLSFIDDAVNRVIELLQQHAGAKNISVQASARKEPEQQTLHPINLSSKDITRALGVELTAKQVEDYLKRIGCNVDLGESADGQFSMNVIPPPHRTDLYIPEDIIEEIAKLYGVNNIPDQQLHGVLHVPEDQPEITAREQIRSILAGLGCTEIYNYSLYGEELIRAVGYDPEKDHVRLANVLSEDVRYLRINLLPRMLENVSRNQYNTPNDLQLFEIGHVFFSDREVQQLGIVVTGKEAQRKLRGIVEELFIAAHIPYSLNQISQQKEGCEYWGQYANNKAVEVQLQNKIAGTFGTVDEEVLERLNINTPVAFATLSIPVIAQASKKPVVQPISPYPAITIDLSFMMPKEMQWGQIEQALEKHFAALLQNVTIFDIYSGEKLPEGMKSIAFSLELQAPDRTLEMKEVEQLRDQCCAALAKDNVQLRAE